MYVVGHTTAVDNRSESRRESSSVRESSCGSLPPGLRQSTQHGDHSLMATHPALVNPPAEFLARPDLGACRSETKWLKGPFSTYCLTLREKMQVKRSKKEPLIASFVCIIWARCPASRSRIENSYLSEVASRKYHDRRCMTGREELSVMKVEQYSWPAFYSMHSEHGDTVQSSSTLYYN